MLTQVAYVCHACGFVTAAELYPDPRAAERRVQFLRKRGKPLWCPSCRSRDVEIVARPAVTGGGAA